MPDLLLELYSEEIPARMQRPAARGILRQLTEKLAETGLQWEGDAAVYVTPRRVSVSIAGLSSESPAAVTARRGPRAGAPERAVSGFARSAGVLPRELELRHEPKGEFYFAVIKTPGRPLGDVLSKTIPEVLEAFRWPKSMRWGSGAFRWVRPLRSVLAILSENGAARVLDFSVGGVAAGDTSCGNTAMCPDRFSVASFCDYQNKLRERFVILDPDERETAILRMARENAGRHGLELVDDPELCAEIAGLVEWPVPMIGKIERRFLSLPEEILVTTMRTHQRYLAGRSRRTGQITHFIVVANRTSDDGEQIILEGNRLVLKARLEDAEFVWANDLRRIRRPSGVEDMLSELGAISFHHRLGSLGERVERLASLAAAIAAELGIDPASAAEAAKISKIDLVSETVGEFPELQGIIGGYFAAELGLDDRCAAACAEQYLPAGPDDTVPSAGVSVAVGLADRIDQLAGFFGIDGAPSGSKDPFALRRAATGIVDLVCQNGLRLPMLPLIAQACRQYGAEEQAADVANAVIAFVHERLKVRLRASMRHDVVAACIAMKDSDDLTLLVRRAEALTSILGTGAGARLLHGFRRANNIIEAECGKDAAFGRPSSALARLDAERQLFSALKAANRQIDRDLEREDLRSAMETMADLSEPIDRFFEEVRVNVDDKRLRANRLGLLAAFRDVAGRIADLALIEH